MITFADLIKTKEELKDTDEFKEEIQKIESVYNLTTDYNRNLMTSINKLVGKYYRQPKKAIVHTYPIKSDGYQSSATTLQISKKGIGKVYGYHCNITPFTYLVSTGRYSSDNKGLLKEVIEKDDIFNKARNVLSPNGQEILDSIKEVYLQNKIDDPAETTIIKTLDLSEDEKQIIGKDKIYLQITDHSNTLSIRISQNKTYSSYNSYNVVEDFNGIKLDDKSHFIDYLIINNHRGEIVAAIEEYKTITAPKLEAWQKFNTALKEKLAKYLILDAI